MPIKKAHIVPHEVKVTRRREVIKSFKAKADAKRTRTEKFADWMTSYFGSINFLIINVAWFIIWIGYNTIAITGIVPFDPFPFGLLTMIVSLEAICLAVIVLISQNREARIAELREEVDLQINTITENELTKAIYLMTVLMEKNGINIDDDPDLKEMLLPVRSEEIERHLLEQLK